MRAATSRPAGEFLPGCPPSVCVQLIPHLKQSQEELISAAGAEGHTSRQVFVLPLPVSPSLPPPPSVLLSHPWPLAFPGLNPFSVNFFF